MTTYKELVEAVRPLAEQISGLYDEAARRYKPQVDAMVRSGCRDVKSIEQVLDGLLDSGDGGTPPTGGSLDRAQERAVESAATRGPLPAKPTHRPVNPGNDPE